MSILRSLGLKRYISTVLTTAIGVLASAPETAFLVPFVVKLAALFGLTGIAHAGKEGLKDLKGISLVSLFSILVFASQHIAALSPYTHLLQIVASALGVTVISLSGAPGLSAEDAETVAKAKALIMKAADKENK